MKTVRRNRMDEKMNKSNLPPNNNWKNTAFLYNFDNRGYEPLRVEFDKQYVERTKGNILLTACGTGSTTIPLAESTDRKFYALDFSEHMLKIFHGKMEKNQIPNLYIKNANMIDFNFDIKFGLIILDGIMNLTDDLDVRLCLANALNHLSDGGLMVVGMFYPASDYGESWIGTERKVYDVYDDITGKRVVRYTKKLSSDTKKQIFTYLSRYEVIDKNNDIEHFSDEIVTRYYYREQFESLLTETGFEILEYHKITEGYKNPEQHFVCKKRCV